MSKVKAVSHITLKRDPKGIDRIVLEYALGTSETVAPTTGWTTAQLSRPEGKYLWRRERTYYTDGTSSVGSAVNITGDKGDPGSSGTSISAQFSADGSSNWHSPAQEGDKYIRIHDGTQWGAPIKIYGEQGPVGPDGKKGPYTDYTFAISSKASTASPSTAPADCTSWTDGVQTPTASRPYLWMRKRYYIVSEGNEWVLASTTFARITGEKGDKGDPGDGMEMIFTLSSEKPARPEGDNPSGWLPTPQDSTSILRSGDFILEGGKYHSGVTPDDGQKIDVLTISGQKVGDTLTINAGACCENNYDFLMVGQLDVAASSLTKANRSNSSYVALALTGIVGSNGYNMGSVKFTFADTAPHTVVIKYFKDHSNGYGEDKGYYTFSTSIKKRQWMSARSIRSGVKSEWSDPVPFGNRGDRGAASRGPRDFATGELYLAGDEGEEFYDIVYYDGLYYRCTKTHISSEGENPFDEVGHGYDTWEVANNYSFVATKVAFIGDGLEGWIVDNGVLRHSSGLISLTRDGTINAGSGQFVVDRNGNMTAKSGTFAGFLQMPFVEIDSSTCQLSGGNYVLGSYNNLFVSSNDPKTLVLPVSADYVGRVVNIYVCTIMTKLGHGLDIICQGNAARIIDTITYQAPGTWPPNPDLKRIAIAQGYIQLICVPGKIQAGTPYWIISGLQSSDYELFTT